MRLPFHEQVVKFFDKQGVQLFAALGVTKAVELVVLHYADVWYAASAAFLTLCLCVLYIASRSTEINL